MAGIRHLVSMLGLVAVLAPAGRAAADVTGKIALTGTAGKPPLRGKAFLDRSENPYLGGKTVDAMPYVVVVLEKDGITPPTPPQVKWKLLGDSFDRPLVPVFAGSEVVIENESRGQPVLHVDGHPDLIAKAPLTKNGELAFTATGDHGTLLTVLDEDTPHLQGSVLVLSTPYFVGATSVGKTNTEGKYTIAGVADGTYTLHVWYRTGWLEGVEHTVEVKDGKATQDLTLPPGLKTAGAAAKE